MAALNRSETEGLQAVRDLLTIMIADTRKPPKDREWFATLSPDQEKVLKVAKDHVHTVVTMKGYYPS